MRLMTEENISRRENFPVLQNITNQMHLRSQQQTVKKSPIQMPQYGPQGRITSMMQKYLATRMPNAAPPSVMPKQIQTDITDADCTIPDEFPEKNNSPTDLSESMSQEFSIIEEGEAKRLPETTYKLIQVFPTKSIEMRIFHF